jgi:serine/threonine-protein kinase
VVAYEKSLALDPGYAPAWAGLSSATDWVADSADTPKAFTDGMRQARLAADKAVQLAPALADGYVVRALFRASYSWDWDGARADIQRALALSPEDPDVLIGYGGLLVSLGRAMEGVAVQRKVVQRDPLNARAWRALGAALLFSGQFAEAREPLNRSLEISPVQSIVPMLLGSTYLLEKNPTAALAIFERSSSDMFRRFGLALAAHDLGRAEESQRALDSLIARDADSAAFQIAMVYAWRGDKDQAFQWLERAYRQHDGGLSVLKVNPVVRPLRGDPRYTALLKKMNLPLD